MAMMILYVRQKRDTDVKNRLLDSVGEGDGGMIWENNIETCMLPYVKQMTMQIQCMKQGTQSWCSGTTQRYQVWRDEGQRIQDGWK